jgi:N utilization substance protein B
LGVIEKMPVLDVMIARFSKGWKVSRLSHVSRAVLRLGAYELMYSDLPVQIAMNEAIVLAKKFEDPKARPFVNGVLNGIKDEIEATGKVECVAKIEAAVKETEGETTSESANSTAPAEEV